jgi:hypothetical protein
VSLAGRDLPNKAERSRTREAARRAQLPTSGRVEGRITIVQEDRFRLEDATGRGYLFILGRKSGVSSQELNDWRAGCVPISVDYEGAPDMGAVARHVGAVPK